MAGTGLDPWLRTAWDEQAVSIARWLEGLRDADLEQPASLAGWRVAELVVHLGQVATALSWALAAPRPSRAAKPLAIASYTSGYAGAAAEIAARERANAAGLDAAGARARFAEELDRLRAGLDGLDGANPVVAARRGPIRVNDMLRTRVAELVVHSRDVARSLPERPGPELVPAAVKVTVRMLAEVLAEQHPGRAVEVRVPPYVAVQVGAGPVHTRGTPPNVVETDPGTFVDLATGRVSFPAATRTGTVRASGSRADLTPYLPVLA